MSAKRSGKRSERTIWYDRKRIWCGLPWTFTTYTLTDDDIVIKTGVLSQKYDSIKLYRVVDITITRSLPQRIFGLSTITLNTMDRSTEGVVALKNIRRGFDVEQTIQDAVDAARSANGVRTREYYGAGMGHPDGGMGDPGMDGDGDGMPDGFGHGPGMGGPMGGPMM